MIYKIRSYRSLLLAALLCGATTAPLLAQEAGAPPMGGPADHHHGPPPSPLFDALDTNHDGVLSADEMANAPTALRGLLIPGSNELRREDLRPAPRPPREEENGGPLAAREERSHHRPMLRHHLPPQAENEEMDAPDQDRPDVDEAPFRHHDRPDLEDAPRPHRHHGGPEADRAPRPGGPEADDAQQPGGPEAREAGKLPPPPRHGPRPSPVFDALDTDHNGIISSEEMNRSADTLKNLLKDGVNELRREDLRRAQPSPQPSATQTQTQAPAPQPAPPTPQSAPPAQ